MSDFINISGSVLWGGRNRFRNRGSELSYPKQIGKTSEKLEARGKASVDEITKTIEKRTQLKSDELKSIITKGMDGTKHSL